MQRQPPASAVEGKAEVIRISARKLKTPVGVLQVVASDDAVLYVELPRRGETEPPFERWLLGRGETPVLRTALAQLREYFAGKRRDFDVPVGPAGTLFQQRVWHLVATIPYGETVSYGSIAAQLGSSPRAVGAAVGANPIPIIIPCHRVIGADNSLTGYGGGLRMKIWLLRHERALLA
jgi:methylated-DNA-[protein]-cysteine S-methyltransferase